jgi:hypothetical protein
MIPAKPVEKIEPLLGRLAGMPILTGKILPIFSPKTVI